MNEFFKFLFNFEIIKDVLRPEWIKLYDFLYVDNLIVLLQKNNEIYNDLITSIYSKASAGSVSTSTKDNSVHNQPILPKKVTIPEPFNLTKPKQRIILEPIAIPCKFEVNIVPDFTKFNLEKLDEENKKRREDKNIVNYKI